MNVKLLTIWLLLFFFTINVSIKAFAYNISGASWPGSTTTYYSTGGSSDTTFDSAFVEAMNNWNFLSNFLFTNTTGFKDPCSDPNNNPGGPWFNGWEFRSDLCGTPFGGSTLAVNISWSTGSTIIQAGTVFNTSVTWDVHNGSGSNFDFRRVATHELGHALGLGHDNSFPALMNTFYSQSIEAPQTDDINGLRAIYGGNNTLAQLHAASPETITVGDMDGNGKDEVILDFGSSGIWIRWDNGMWTQLHTRSPETITTGDIDGNGKSEVIMDFGSSGIWIRWDNGMWTQLHTRSPETITVGDIDGNGKSEVIMDFGSSGIWIRWDSGMWTQLHTLSPETVTTGDIDGNGNDEVILDFGSLGIWIRWDSGMWTQLHTLSPETVTTGDIDGNGKSEVILDFGGSGIWIRWDNGVWEQLHTLLSETIATGDIDGNGKSEVIIDFGSLGIWMRMGN